MSADSWITPAIADAADPVRIHGLGVDYGDFRALDAVGLRVPAGEVFGLLGPNGAGKTTMFRVLATLLRPTRGEVFLCGESIQAHPGRIRRNIAYMPDLAPMPSDLRAAEYLYFFAGAYGLRGAERQKRVDECLDAVRLRDRAKDFCTQLSLGMRQRLALAKAMLHRPNLLILDEPASGLDPVARSELKAALRQQAEEGATIILSSHVMAEIQDMCTSIGLLKRGNLLDAGPVRNVLARFSDSKVRIVIRAPGHRDRAAAWLANLGGVTVDSRFPDAESIQFQLDDSGPEPAALFTALGEARLGVTSMRAVETSVEEVVLRLGIDTTLP